MKLSETKKLFVGLRVDGEMRRALDAGPTPGRPLFKPGDPAHLDVFARGEQNYIGRVLEPGFSVDHFDDLQRNIRSILRLRFPDQKTAGSLFLFALEDGADEAFERAVG